MEARLPPSTVLVVNQGTRLPGEGFVAWDTYDLPEAYARVYSHDWNSLRNPFSLA